MLGPVDRQIRGVIRVERDRGGDRERLVDVLDGAAVTVAVAAVVAAAIVAPATAAAPRAAAIVAPAAAAVVATGPAAAIATTAAVARAGHGAVHGERERRRATDRLVALRGDLDRVVHRARVDR